MSKTQGVYFRLPKQFDQSIEYFKTVSGLSKQQIAHEAFSAYFKTVIRKLEKKDSAFIVNLLAEYEKENKVNY